MLLRYYMRLQLESFMVLVSGYVECVKLLHIWKPQPHAVVYQLYTALCSSISLIYHGMALSSLPQVWYIIYIGYIRTKFQRYSGILLTSHVCVSIGKALMLLFAELVTNVFYSKPD